MKNQIDTHIPKDFVIGKGYRIQFPITNNKYTRSYRGYDNDNNIKWIDIFELSSLPSYLFDENQNLVHISILKTIENNNVLRYLEDFPFIYNEKRFHAIIFEFKPGETLFERMKREPFFSSLNSALMLIDLLDAFKCLHSLPIPIIHNNINPLNIFLDYSKKTDEAMIFGFEQARFFEPTAQDIYKEDLSPFFSAPELFEGKYSPQSDIFSMGCLLFNMMFSMPPWYSQGILNQDTDNIIEILKKSRGSIPDILLKSDNIIDINIRNILITCLEISPENRFRDANELLRALKGEVQVSLSDEKIYQFRAKQIAKKKEPGNGFDLVAGMQALKDILYNDVIRALQEKSLYEKYGLTIPNGILLYGPPGCGKTFFSEKLAEEIAYNFIILNPSDIQSKFINATQENIKKIFDEAEKNAPTVIFIDELDAILPSREMDLHQMYSSAVNEFLAQMNNCGQKNIFIIGATNRPEKIDPAVLRTGRFDKVFYISPPDSSTREALFRLYLKKRPVEDDLNYDKLSKLTDNYISSDIKFVIDEASREALKKLNKISMDILCDVIQDTPPSLTLLELKKYEQIREKWENERKNIKTAPNKIGFI